MCSKIIHLIRAHFKERSVEDLIRSLFNTAYAKLFSEFLYDSICCGCSFEIASKSLGNANEYPQHILL